MGKGRESVSNWHRHQRAEIFFHHPENNDGDAALGCKEKAEPISQCKHMELRRKNGLLWRVLLVNEFS